MCVYMIIYTYHIIVYVILCVYMCIYIYIQQNHQKVPEITQFNPSSNAFAPLSRVSPP